MGSMILKWVLFFVIVSAVTTLEVKEKDESTDLNPEMHQRDKRQITVGDFKFPTANQPGGNVKPNCRGRNRRRPECQKQNRPINCNKRKNKRKPHCLRNTEIAGAFEHVEWFDSLAAPNKSALQIPRLPGTPGQGQESRFFQIGQGEDIPFHQCVTPKFEAGHCRYLQHCILPEFANDFNTFLNYVCFIHGQFIGACCPDSRYPSLTTPKPKPIILPTAATPRPKPTERGCGVTAKNNHRIVGGKRTNPQEWPWMAALLRDGSDQYCGGVLITNAHVLTAAHCVKPFPASSITVRLGEYTFDQTHDSRHQDFRIKSIQIHERYNTETYENDIAIISIQGSVEFNDDIWPICLPPADNNKYVGEKATATGWGTIYYGGPVSQYLQEVTLPVWTNTACDAAYGDHDIVDNFLCAGIPEGGQDSCQGDSGGPLQWQDPVNGRWAAIGVVSWGIKCAQPNNPGVYTRVSNYIEWIRANAI